MSSTFVKGFVAAICDMTDEQHRAWALTATESALKDDLAKTATDAAKNGEESDLAKRKAQIEEDLANAQNSTDKGIAICQAMMNLWLSVIIFAVSKWIIGNMLESGRQIILSGFNTLFVCYAEFPQGLEIEDPTFADIMRSQIQKNKKMRVKTRT